MANIKISPVLVSVYILVSCFYFPITDFRIQDTAEPGTNTVPFFFLMLVLRIISPR